VKSAVAKRSAAASATGPRIPAGVSCRLTRSIAGARGYDLVAGYLSLLRGSGGDFSQATIGCVLNDTPETSWTFFGAPPVGNGYWFLVRDVFCGGNGTFDSLGAGQVAPRDPGIDASGRGCP